MVRCLWCIVVCVSFFLEDVWACSVACSIIIKLPAVGWGGNECRWREWVGEQRWNSCTSYFWGKNMKIIKYFLSSFGLGLFYCKTFYIQNGSVTKKGLYYLLSHSIKLMLCPSSATKTAPQDFWRFEENNSKIGHPWIGPVCLDHQAFLRDWSRKG